MSESQSDNISQQINSFQNSPPKNVSPNTCRPQKSPQTTFPPLSPPSKQAKLGPSEETSQRCSDSKISSQLAKKNCFSCSVWSKNAVRVLVNFLTKMLSILSKAMNKISNCMRCIMATLKMKSVTYLSRIRTIFWKNLYRLCSLYKIICRKMMMVSLSPVVMISLIQNYRN